MPGTENVARVLPFAIFVIRAPLPPKLVEIPDLLAVKRNGPTLTDFLYLNPIAHLTIYTIKRESCPHRRLSLFSFFGFTGETLSRSIFSFCAAASRSRGFGPARRFFFFNAKLTVKLGMKTLC